jgi:hypothetical protein
VSYDIGDFFMPGRVGGRVRSLDKRVVSRFGFGDFRLARVTAQSARLLQAERETRLCKLVSHGYCA